MKVDITSMFFNSKIEGKSATAAWGTSIGQSISKKCRIETDYDGVIDFIIGLTYKSKTEKNNYNTTGMSNSREILLFSVFDKVFINNQILPSSQYTIALVRENTESHNGRLSISYAPYLGYNNKTNKETIAKMQSLLGVSDQGCWFVYDISIANQDEIHFNAVVVNPNGPDNRYVSSQERSKIWSALIPANKIGPSTTSSSSSTPPPLDLPIQLIRYGAPGTGKSNGVKEITEQYKDRTIRTTFHPDSDYSTFVGSYKPVMHNPNDKILSVTELEAELKKMKGDNVKYPIQKLGATHWKSLQGLSSDVVKTILSRCDFGDTYYPEIQKGIAVGVTLSQKHQASESKIIYKYVPQAFLKAYVDAWKQQDKPEFLVIEEINRGNCAQIFGDLFQLLDRNDDGVSDYPISPDKDIQIYLQEEFAGCDNVPDNIKSGAEMILPNNLYIWATMNTSDQSLFPIDSAFKRRWDWEYVPIANADKNWKIKIGSEEYDWWEFLQKINAIISSITDSADKQLGYFFCKSKDGIINGKTFVNKVVFYLWNDVFKDYGFDDTRLFGYKKDDSDKTEILTFSDFYKESGDVNEKAASVFVENVINWVSSNSGN